MCSVTLRITRRRTARLIAPMTTMRKIRNGTPSNQSQLLAAASVTSPSGSDVAEAEGEGSASRTDATSELIGRPRRARRPGRCPGR